MPTLRDEQKQRDFPQLNANPRNGYKSREVSGANATTQNENAHS